jgi:nitrilase
MILLAGGAIARAWASQDQSNIVDPAGSILAGPARHEETILYADIDLAAVRAARRYFDPVGHYHRPDIFQLHVDNRARPPSSSLRHPRP